MRSRPTGCIGVAPADDFIRVNFGLLPSSELPSSDDAFVTPEAALV